jgi:Holliday junction resolvase-like predicted endonuclease
MADGARRMLEARRRKANRASAAALALLALALGVLALGAAIGGTAVLIGVIGFWAAVTGFAVKLSEAHKWENLAQRSRIGIRSEDTTTQHLAVLADEGWKIRRSVNWQGPGDIDLIATAPTGVGFAIEVKTRRYTPEQLERARQQAAWLARRRRKWCPAGAHPVLCPAAERGLCHHEQQVLICTPELLADTLARIAGR